MLQQHPPRKSARPFINLNAPSRKPILDIKRNKAPKKTNVLSNKKKNFPRLTDPSLRLQLQREFSPYSALAVWYYNSTAKVAAYLRAHLNSADTVASVGYLGRDAAVAANKKKPELDYNDLVKQLTIDAASAGRRLRIKGDTVAVSLQPLTFQVPVVFNEENKAEFISRMTKLFGNFRIPTRMQTDTAGISRVDMPEYSTGAKSIEFYSRLRLTPNASPGFYAPPKLDIDPVETGADIDDDDDDDNAKRSQGMRRRVKTNIANVKDALVVEVKIKNVTVERFGRAIADNNLDNATFIFTFQVLGGCKFPLEYALWATHATDRDEFVPKLFREHFDRVGLMQVLPRGGTYRANLHARTMHMGTIKQLNQQRIKEYSIEVRPRVNQENFCILNNGSVLYVPDQDNTDFYVKILRESYDTENGTIKHNNEIPEIKNKILLSDWINDQLAYTDDSGKVSTVSLSGAIPLDDTTITHWLYVNFSKQSEGWRTNIANFGRSVCNEFNLYNPEFAGNMNMLVARDFATLFNSLETALFDIGFATAWKAANNPEDDQINDITKAWLKEFVRLCRAIANKWMDTRHLAIITKLQYYFYFKVFGEYSSRLAAFDKTYATSLKINATPERQELKTEFKIPNAPGITKALPHQQESLTISSRDEPPVYLIEEIDAGGGKTLQMFVHALLLKEKNKIKTAFFICPGRLVKEWTSEINKMTKGEVNVIPITTNVIRKLRDHLGWDKLQFLQYLKSAPINTVFVCSINFLGLPKDHFANEHTGSIMQYGETFVHFFPNVQILRQLNPDFIALDESHYIKNEKSRRTRSFFGLSPIAKYRTIGSGTISPDNPADMVAQYAALNPAILGTRDQFTERYGIEQNGKFIRLKPGMGNELSAVRRPYVARVHKTRADWSFLLPAPDVELTRCFLTENQQNYYDFMLSEEMERLRNDPKIRKLIEEADPEKQKQLERMLDAKLWVVEEFVNAPDSNDGFQKWADGLTIGEDGGVVAAASRPRAILTEEDFVSCKVKKIDDILDQHFNVNKDPNKVIVFGINKVVSRHIFQHTRFRGTAVHYAVQNSLSKMSANEALLAFRNNPKIKWLVADATSMREGLNLQTASRVIYVQTEWTPGAQEQAISRAWRPDVADQFKRERITISKLYAINTYEVAKVAKLINKEVVTKDVNNIDNSEWQKYVKSTPIPELEPIKLNLDYINDVRDFNHRLVAPSIICYRSIHEWEQRQFDESKARITRYTAQRLGKPENEIDLRRDAMLPVHNSSKLPNSKYIFTPLEDGAVPIDKRNLNLVPIAVAKIKENDDDDERDEDDDDDSDKVEIEDNINYTEGDLVQTEYGFGYIRKDNVRQVKVEIPGFNGGEPITLSKMVVFKPQPPGDNHPTLEHDDWAKNVRQLEKDMRRAGGKGITFLQGYQTPIAGPSVEPVTKKPPKADHPAVPPERKIAPQPDHDEEEEEVRKPAKKPAQSDRLPPSSKAKLEIMPLVINGTAAMAAYTDEAGFSRLQAHHGNWRKVPPFMAIHVKTFNGALRLAKGIQDAGLKVVPGPIDPKTKKRQPDQLARMQGLAKRLRGTNDPKLVVRNNKINYSNGLKNPFVFDHSAPNDKSVIKLYPVIWNDQLLLTAPVNTQPAQIKKLIKVQPQGCGKWGKPIRDFAIQLFPGPNRLKNTLKQIAKSEKLTNYDEAQLIVNDPLFSKMVGI